MRKIAVVYWSGTGNTEKMAEAVCSGIVAQGLDADLLQAGNVDVGGDLPYRALALGCPAMGNEVLEESEMEPFVAQLESRNMDGVLLVLFGSYDWGDGEWMRNWEQRMKAAGATLVTEGLIIQGMPEQSGLEQCRELGRRLATAIDAK